jgi:hypothetical protein
MVFLPSHSQTPGRHLEWRLRLFTIGALLGVGGMIMDERWLVWLAMAVLAVAFAVRFLPGSSDPDDDSAPPSGEGHRETEAPRRAGSDSS